LGGGGARKGTGRGGDEEREEVPDGCSPDADADDLAVVQHAFNWEPEE
jgi:hypothetical protein